MERRQVLALAAAASLAPTGLVRAQQGYPAQPVKLVAPFPPGGTVDILSRSLADQMGRELGRPMIVDNRGGAGGTIGADLVAKSQPDGYTVLFGAVHHAIAQSVYPKLPYDIRQMTPIGFLGRVNHAVIVNNALPAKNIAELIALLKASPEKYSYATPGSGTMQHLMTEYFKSVTGTEMMHVPYRGSGPAIVDLIAGNVHVMFETMPSALQHIKAGSVRVLAVTSAQRAKYLPDVPTVSESGAANYDATSWYGVFGPANTPAAVVKTLNSAINASFKNQAFVDRWVGVGADPGGGAPDVLAKLTASEVARWAEVAKKANISVS
ncbi:Bug family tripartite tricarboxylate transporter substrate binding protein [Variovorax paradoxus]|jgi:tripartite-type tricarboxylate transporter receptor subunit TctC|uniref:BUG-like extracytoplasmic solute receptor protein n=2 Tax=Variovorax paradoxus TaxID=34073 RepID=A0A0H2M801_VARPD|nr:tripartite tricarboxylate transporter substrate binding protein [Variovorax paradoxus]KLN58428.1 BUG-like extracytoplasmic solute receptor protein [Variovorax paradoxus]